MRYRDQEDDELERMRSRRGRTPSRRTKGSYYGEPAARRRKYNEEPEDSYEDEYEYEYDDAYDEEYDDGQWYDEDYNDGGFGEDDLEAVYLDERPVRSGAGRTGKRTAAGRRTSAGENHSGRSGSRNNGAGAGYAAARGRQPQGGGRNARRRGGEPASEEARLRQQARLKKKKRRKLVRNVLLLILVAWLGSTAWAFFHKQTGTWTIAVFGVDSRDGGVEKNALADVQMICTVDRATGEIKLVSVYRDTYLKINSEGTFHKINEAYFKGGHKQAVSALEENLDLRIDNYATFNWKAVADGINILGGVDLEITEPEFKYINAFITETVESTGIGSYQLERPGMNHLDGVQAVAYCRLRLMDTDYQRTERQRKVVSLALEKAKQADAKTLTSLVMAVMPQLSTDIGVNDVLPMAKDVKKYHLGETGGFPFSRQAKRIGRMDCVIPTTLESNVVQLHQFLYGTEGYKPSSAVKKISQRISEESGLYEEGKPAPTGGSGGGGGTSGQTQAPVQTEPQTAPPETTEPETTVEETTEEETTTEETTEETKETETGEIGPGITPTTQARETTSGGGDSSRPEDNSGPGGNSGDKETGSSAGGSSGSGDAGSRPGSGEERPTRPSAPAEENSPSAPSQTPGDSQEGPGSNGPGGPA